MKYATKLLDLHVKTQLTELAKDEAKTPKTKQGQKNLAAKVYNRCLYIQDLKSASKILAHIRSIQDNVMKANMLKRKQSDAFKKGKRVLIVTPALKKLGNRISKQFQDIVDFKVS